MSDYTSIEFYDDEFELPPLELPPPKEMLDFNDIIHNVVWGTIPDEWGGSEDDKLVGYVYEMMDRVKKKYRGYIMGKLLKILEDEDNNN